MTQTPAMLEARRRLVLADTSAMPNAVRFCCACSYALQLRRGRFDYNCVNCNRPEAELVTHVYGVFVCVNTEKCSRAQVGTAAAPRPFVCKTCHEGDVEGKDGVMIDAKEITRLIVGPGHCECGERVNSCALDCSTGACTGALIWRARGVHGCSKECCPDEVVTGTTSTTSVDCSCGKTTEQLMLNNFRGPTRRRQRSPTPPPAVKVEVKEEPSGSDHEDFAARQRAPTKKK
jgi:hypothetical protein